MSVNKGNEELNENIRGMRIRREGADPVVWLMIPPPAVLGQDPLIPPQLLQAEIPAVWPRSFKASPDYPPAYLLLV